jgi:hypothetical protein
MKVDRFREKGVTFVTAQKFGSELFTCCTSCDILDLSGWLTGCCQLFKRFISQLSNRFVSQLFNVS